MSVFPKIFRSLFLTALLSFTAPVALVGGMLASLLVASEIPGFEGASRAVLNGVLQFLEIFGSGSPLQGTLTIGLTGSFVGSLFDLCTFYRYQHLKGDEEVVEISPPTSRARERGY